MTAVEKAEYRIDSLRSFMIEIHSDIEKKWFSIITEKEWAKLVTSNRQVEDTLNQLVDDEREMRGKIFCGLNDKLVEIKNSKNKTNNWQKKSKSIAQKM